MDAESDSDHFEDAVDDIQLHNDNINTDTDCKSKIMDSIANEFDVLLDQDDSGSEDQDPDSIIHRQSLVGDEKSSHPYNPDTKSEYSETNVKGFETNIVSDINCEKNLNRDEGNGQGDADTLHDTTTSTSEGSDSKPNCDMYIHEQTEETITEESMNAALADEENEPQNGAEGGQAKPKDEVEIEEEELKAKELLMSDEEKELNHSEANRLKAEGNDVFKDNKMEEARKKYTQAILLCPLCYGKDRSIMFSNRAACHFREENYDSCIKDCTKALDINPNYLKALARRAEAYEKSEKLDEALEDYQKALQMDPSMWKAREACQRLPEEIKERNEKLKTEMIGKLKDLGNMILKPFGLSTENFQLNQDPNTGSYSVNFQQKPSNGK